MTLRTSGTWWAAFLAVPTFLITLNWLAGLVLLGTMAWATYRSP